MIYVLIAMSIFFFVMSVWYSHDVSVALEQGDIETASRLDAEWVAGMAIYMSFYLGGVFLHLLEVMGL